MSAFVVSDRSITGMLQAASPQYPGDGATYYWQSEPHYFGGHTQEIAQKLLDENYRSVNYRYSETSEPHRWQAQMVRHLEPVEIIRLCDCYAYQACETSDWHETEAYAIMQYLKQRAIRNLPGYDDAKGDI